MRERITFVWLLRTVLWLRVRLIAVPTVSSDKVVSHLFILARSFWSRSMTKILEVHCVFAHPTWRYLPTWKRQAIPSSVSIKCGLSIIGASTRIQERNESLLIEEQMRHVPLQFCAGAYVTPASCFHPIHRPPIHQWLIMGAINYTPHPLTK